MAEAASLSTSVVGELNKYLLSETIIAIFAWYLGLQRWQECDMSISAETPLEWVRLGNLDQLVLRRKAMLDAVVKTRTAAPAELMAGAARGMFLAGEPLRAGEALKRFAARDPGLASASPVDRANLQVQRAVMLYFENDLQGAAHAAHVAHVNVMDARIGLGVDRLIAGANAAIWAARADFRAGRSDIAASHLHDPIRRLTVEFAKPAMPEYRAGVAVAMAECLEVLGAIAWAAGRNDEAKTRIYRCIAVMSLAQDVKASLFRWFGVHLAGKCDATKSSQGFNWALALADLAVKNLGEAGNALGLEGNAWLATALIQRGQTKIKAEQIAPAKEDLKQAEKELDKLVSRNPREAAQLRLDVLLARVWIAAKAAETTGAPRDWHACYRLAQELTLSAPAGGRMKIEGSFQSGRALVHSDAVDDRNLGRRILTKDVIKATNPITKVTIAATLSLAENSMIENQYQKAGKHLETARALLVRPDGSSTYLEKWEARLTRALNETVATGVATLRFTQSYEKFITAAREAYVQYHAHVHNDEGRFMEVTELSRASYFRAKKAKEQKERALKGKSDGEKKTGD